MGNMSYCRHENTMNDLRDVVQQWGEWEDDEEENTASWQETAARAKLIRLARELVEMTSDDDLIMLDAMADDKKGREGL